MMDQKRILKVVTVRGDDTALTASADLATVDRAPAEVFEAVTHVVYVGVGGITFTTTNKIELVLQHSDNGTAWTAAPASAVVADDGVTVTTGIFKSFVAAHATATTYTVGYVGGKRYTRVQAVFGGTHATGTSILSTAILGSASYAPVAQ